jgi:DNA-binding GntR family transcriptional regulator
MMKNEVGSKRQGSEAVISGRTLIRPSALVTDVYNAILERITSNQIYPGAKITVDNLARELGVSQTPIREALSRLEAEGLVLKTYLVGYSAAPRLSRTQVEQVFELRLLLEPAAAAKAASRLSDQDQKALHALHNEMVSLRDNPSPAYSEYARMDTQFHSVIATESGNVLLAEALARLHTQVHIFRLGFPSRLTAEAVAEHAEILSALIRGDARASKKAMRIHVLASQDRMLSLFPS